MAEAGIAAAEASPAASQLRSYQLRFHGRGGEYFGIWIVNLLLSVVTLGIYSAWAKVRTLRYMHGATELDGSRFGYHARPLSILIGRAVAVALIVVYAVAQKTSPVSAVVLTVVGVLFVPWVIWRAARFRLYVTSYRNIRFGFESTGRALRQAYVRFLLLPILAVPTVGLILPYAHHQQLRWLAENSRYGTTRLSVKPGVGAFYLAYLLFFLRFMGIVIFVGIITAVVAILLYLGGVSVLPHTTEPAGLAHMMGELFLPLGAFYLLLISASVAFHSWLLKLMLDRISLAGVQVSARYRWWPLVWLYFSNILLMILTLGLYYPWARCRTARYLVDRIELRAAEGLDQFFAGSGSEKSAIADQIASSFAIDIGIGI